MKDGVALCMIAKDVSASIGMALESVRTLVGQMIVAVDDRTSDDTVKIAAALGAETHLFTFEHFGKARDYSLSFADHKWIFVLDADETIDIDCVPTIKDAIKTISADAFKFPRRNWANLEKTAIATFPHGAPIPYPDYQIRLFRNRPSIKYGEQYVHEVPNGYRNCVIMPGDVHINHFQFIFKTSEAAHASFVQYEALKARAKERGEK